MELFWSVQYVDLFVALAISSKLVVFAGDGAERGN